jgi:hypothetical protein
LFKKKLKIENSFYLKKLKLKLFYIKADDGAWMSIILEIYIIFNAIYYGMGYIFIFLKNGG